MHLPDMPDTKPQAPPSLSEAVELTLASPQLVPAPNETMLSTLATELETKLSTLEDRIEKTLGLLPQEKQEALVNSIRKEIDRGGCAANLIDPSLTLECQIATIFDEAFETWSHLNRVQERRK
ncbi:MAG: hypothetical protein KDD42_05365, partial [Bdellovibrionales bacterium]|nr:hypothetical protein [Bdellovibrionales bacterium]